MPLLPGCADQGEPLAVSTKRREGRSVEAAWADGGSRLRTANVYLDLVSATVHLALPEDVTVIADIWATAMQSEPMVYWPLTGDTPEAIRAMFSSLALEYVAVRSVWIDATCCGAAAWLSPDLIGQLTAIDERVEAAIAPHTDDNGKAYARFGTGSASRCLMSRCGFSTSWQCHRTHRGPVWGVC